MDILDNIGLYGPHILGVSSLFILRNKAVANSFETCIRIIISDKSQIAAIEDELSIMNASLMRTTFSSSILIESLILLIITESVTSLLAIFNLRFTL